MAAWIIQNQITDKSKLIEFDTAGYQYNEAASKNNELVFLRDEQA